MLRVECADGSVLNVGRVKPANGKEMGAEPFWNGVYARACRAEKRGERVSESLMVFGSLGA